ncbi:hypothetical protein [Canibacter oris]|uniref:Uncharacterized protein n=1 Tax=Canibacter oris TaxID=1365628 RepID=A0A840DK19_9MICO|nr:hypothetical protein [Canibacter oris]MBB4072033.1 hypothetical protein [Canibacter oris]
MNSATFKTFMAACGLDSTSFAEFAGYNPRTVRRWCLTIDPPEHAVAALEELAYRIIEMQQVILDGVDDEAERVGGDPETVTVARYRDAEEYALLQPDTGIPFEVHCALVNFVTMSLVAEGYEVEVQYPPLEHEQA